MTFAGINYIAVLVAGALGFWSRRRLVSPAGRAMEGGARLHHRTNPRPSRQGRGALAAHRRLPRRPGHGLDAGRRDRPSRRGEREERCDRGRVHLVRLRHHHAGGQQHLRMRSPKLILLDGGHWLAALVLMGAVIGAWGSNPHPARFARHPPPQAGRDKQSNALIFLNEEALPKSDAPDLSLAGPPAHNGSNKAAITPTALPGPGGEEV